MRWALAVLLALVLAAPAQATFHGKYLQSCPVILNAQVDPLGAPGANPSDHAHSFAGSTAASATSTTGDLFAASTSCFLRTNHSLYWAPQMRSAAGALVPATSFATYYGGFGADPAGIAGGKVQPYPTGIRFLIGDHDSTVLQSTSYLRWHCSMTNAAQLNHPPTSCPAGVGVEVDLNGPACWDGMQLDSPDHMAHLARSAAGGGCPSTHPVRIPQLLAEWFYPPAAVGGCPDSDHGIGPCGRSMHMDVWEAQDPATQDQLTRCINDPARTSESSPLCGIFTYDGIPNANPWLSRAIAWAGTIGYVNSAGNASLMPPVTP